jgi:hypothetical protein
METKQTAVEWFAQEAILLHFNHATKTLPTKVFEVAYMQLINRAKQMEREQIIYAVEWNYKSNMGEVYYQARYGK